MQTAAELAADSNITDLILSSYAEDPQAPVYAVRNGAGGWLDVSFAAFLEQVRAAARGLIACGISPGDKVALFAATSYEWAVMDQAVWFAGGVSVPIYETSSAHQVRHILTDSGTEIVAYGTAAQQNVVAEACADGGPQVLTLPLDAAGLAALADDGSDVPDEQVELARSTATLQDTASIVYTSGTTGLPKGAKITHGNLALGTVNILPYAHEIVGYGVDATTRTLMFLPLAHVLAHAVQVICLYARIQVAHCSSMAQLTADMGSFRPTWLLAVPRVFEKLEAGAAASAEDAGKGSVFRAARATAIEYSEALEAAARGESSGPSPWLRARHALFDRLVYTKIRDIMGGQVRYAVSGASALAPDLAHFFRGIGVEIKEGYGLTETTAPATVNVPGATRLGTVGLPIPGTRVRIAEDDEVLISGPIVFGGYHGQPEASAAALDEDGFLRTGDLGSLDEDGYLRITGRKKELIVTAGGKNVYPTPMEEGLRRHRLVHQVVVVGENRPYVGALLTLDEAELRRWCQDRGRPILSMAEAAEDLDVRAAVQDAVDAVNRNVSRAESIRRFLILDHELTEASGHVTQSMKLKRAAVLDDYAEDIGRLYA